MVSQELILAVPSVRNIVTCLVNEGFCSSLHFVNEVFHRQAAVRPTLDGQETSVTVGHDGAVVERIAIVALHGIETLTCTIERVAAIVRRRHLDVVRLIGREFQFRVALQDLLIRVVSLVLFVDDYIVLQTLYLDVILVSDITAGEDPLHRITLK